MPEQKLSASQIELMRRIEAARIPCCVHLSDLLIEERDDWWVLFHKGLGASYFGDLYLPAKGIDYLAARTCPVCLRPKDEGETHDTDDCAAAESARPEENEIESKRGW